MRKNWLRGPEYPALNYQDPINKGLVGWWLTTQTPKGGKIYDISGKKNHGTLTNGTQWVGPLGRPGGFGALNFDGTDDVVKTAHVSGKTFTWSAWARVGNNAGFKNVLAIPGPSSMLMLFTSSETVAFYSSDGLFGATLGFSGSKLNQWVNITFVREGDSITNGYKAYENGVFKGQANTGIWSSSSVLWIGNRSDLGTQDYLGQIDDVRIYNRVLSGSEIKQLYQASIKGYPNAFVKKIRRSYNISGAVAATTRMLTIPSTRKISIPSERKIVWN